MIKQVKNNITKSFIIMAMAASLPACVNKDEFFEFPDRTSIDSDIWDTEGAVQLHLNRTYDVVIPSFPLQVNISNNRWGIHYASDESYYPDADANAQAALGLRGVLGNNDVRFAGNNYDYNPGGNKYFNIGRCNEAIEFIPKGGMSEINKKIFLGQYYALRAMDYFELVRVYGGVPLPLKPQTVESVYTEGRKSARECFAAIVSDLDNAIALLDGVTWNYETGGGKINKLIATCLKAKVLLYWASPQFNPKGAKYDATRWQDALKANQTAYDLCRQQGKSLVPNYIDIFRLEGSANTEAILVRPFSNSIVNRGHNAESRVRPSSAGGSPNQYYIPTKKMLDAYTMADGNPIGVTGKYVYDDIMFWQNRDPRFKATMAYNGSSYPLNGEANRRQWTYNQAANESNSNGVYVKRFSTPGLASVNVPYTNGLGGSGMDWIELRLAEVMLNYADCLNETGNITEAKNMVRQIRIRAGIEAGSNDYGLGNVGVGEPMSTLLLNERMVEFAFENKRNADLRRTRTMHLLTGPMEKIEVQLVNPPQGANLRDKGVLEAVTNGVTFRDGLNIDDKATYLKYFKQYNRVSNSNYTSYNIPEFHYFYTFHNDFVNNGSNIATTIGWTGGTFDPLN